MKYSKEEKENILKEYNGSGMSAVKFRETQKVGIATLNRWLGVEKNKICKGWSNRK